MRAIGQHHIAFDGGQFVRELFQQRNERQISQHHAVLGMIDDPGDLIVKQARIDGVIDRSDPHDAVPGLEMPPRVPGQRGDTVADADTVFVEPLCQS